MNRKTCIAVLAVFVATTACFSGHVFAGNASKSGASANLRDAVVEAWTNFIPVNGCEIYGVDRGTDPKMILCYFENFIASAEKLSGMPVFVEGARAEGAKQDAEKALRHVNKEFAVWLGKNFIPAPDDPVSGNAVKETYKYLKGFARVYYEAHESLKSNPEYRILLDDIAGGKNVGIGHKRLYDSIAFTYAPGEAASFWIRRTIDGTEAELFKGLEKLLEAYDAVYLEANRRRFAFVSKSKGLRGMQGDYAYGWPDSMIFSGDMDGKYKMVLRLAVDGDNVSGVYRYTRVGKDIPVKGTIDKDGHLRLEEFGNDDGTYSGTFEGELDGSGITGTWFKAPEKRLKFSFERTDVYGKELKYKTWYKYVEKDNDKSTAEKRIVGITLENGDKVTVGFQYYLKKGHKLQEPHSGVGIVKVVLLFGSPDLVYIFGEAIDRSRHRSQVYKVFVKGSPNNVLLSNCGSSGSYASGRSDDGYDFYYSGDTLKVVKWFSASGAPNLDIDVWSTHDEKAELTYKVVDGKRLELQTAIWAAYFGEMFLGGDSAGENNVNEEIGKKKIGFDGKELSLSEAIIKYPAVIDMSQYTGYCD